MVSSFKDVFRYLPPKLAEKIQKSMDQEALDFPDNPYSGSDFITEIRLRRGRKVSFTLSSGRNMPLDVCCQPSEFSCIIARMTENSMHAHAPTIKRGYIRLPNGCRVGLCGRAVMDGHIGSGSESFRGGEAVIANIGEITSINIRIAHRNTNASTGIFETLRKDSFRGGVLFYGPPCSGKTTLLRDIAIRAASGESPLRVAVVDSRGEFRDEEEMSGTLIDLLDGYPKGEGIEQATRTLSPQLIICDEIGGVSEAESILAVQNTGVPLAASAHANSFEELMYRPPLKLLYDNAVFAKYIGIARDVSAPGGLRFSFYDALAKVDSVKVLSRGEENHLQA